VESARSGTRNNRKNRPMLMHLALKFSRDSPSNRESLGPCASRNQ
jgi:hypothetical protein